MLENYAVEKTIESSATKTFRVSESKDQEMIDVENKASSSFIKTSRRARKSTQTKSSVSSRKTSRRLMKVLKKEFESTQLLKRILNQLMKHVIIKNLISVFLILAKMLHQKIKLNEFSKQKSRMSFKDSVT